MIYLYKDLTNLGYSDYKIKKAVQNNEFYLVAKGIYSDNKKYNYLEVICKKHPNAILTLESAAYCYGLIKKQPKVYRVATKQKDRKINNEKIKQTFMSNNLYFVGSNTVKYLGFNINIYDLERLLIEIVRNKKTMNFDVYKSIISSYQKITKLLNKKKLEKYILEFKDDKIEYRINKEVFNKE